MTMVPGSQLPNTLGVPQVLRVVKLSFGLANKRRCRKRGACGEDVGAPISLSYGCF